MRYYACAVRRDMEDGQGLRHVVNVPAYYFYSTP